jgi:RNA polymerase sigma factor (sigma-70 family)
VEKYSDKTILSGIKNRKVDILEFLYNEYFPKVSRLVMTNGGSEHDARDIFQEALIIVFNRLQKNKLVIKSSFHNFFIILCKFMWFRQNNNNNYSAAEGKEGEFFQEDDALATLNDNPGENLIKEQLAGRYEKIYQRHYRKLGGDCKRVLKMFFRKKSFREIASIMGYANEDYARRKKYLCMQYLMKMICQDPEYICLKRKKPD